MPIDDDSLKRIRRRQDTYSRRVKKIREDPNLSGEGKRRAMAVERQNALSDIEQIKTAANTAYESRVRDLERKLFGIRDIPNDIHAAISYRDAQDRVREIANGGEAQQMMARALRNGDDLLARALFDRGWELRGDRIANSGWGEVVNAYVSEMRPDLADDFSELAHLQQINTRERRMHEAIETGVHTPAELSGENYMSPAEQLAAAREAQEAG